MRAEPLIDPRTQVVTFKDALEKSAQPAKTLEDLKEILMKIVGKPVLGHSIIHHVFLEFFKNADENSRSEMIRALGGSVIEMLHTKDGSRVAMQCLWHGTAKDRKAIVKSFKTHVVKIAKEEHGHMVLLAAFDCVDDTKLVDSTVTAELLREPLELMTSASGQKVLSYLVAPRDPRVFHPSIIEILKEGDASVTSKKDPQVPSILYFFLLKLRLFFVFVSRMVGLASASVFAFAVRHNWTAICFLGLRIIRWVNAIH